MSKNKADLIQEIYDEVLNLKSSPLYRYRVENNYLPVIGDGSLDSDIMFIGEAPGKNEAETGKPFCGRSGDLLDEMLAKYDIERKDVYIANILKDRPVDNADPTPEEIEVYAPFLDRQIEIIEPKVIATLGRFSMDYVMEKYGIEKETIGEAHGKVYDLPNIKFVPLYHPAAAIYNQDLKQTLLDDFGVLSKIF